MLSHALPLQWKGESKEEEENIVICSLILARNVQDTHSHTNSQDFFFFFATLGLLFWEDTRALSSGHNGDSERWFECATWTGVIFADLW